MMRLQPPDRFCDVVGKLKEFASRIIRKKFAKLEELMSVGRPSWSNFFTAIKNLTNKERATAKSPLIEIVMVYGLFESYHSNALGGRSLKVVCGVVVTVAFGCTFCGIDSCSCNAAFAAANACGSFLYAACTSF